MTPTAILCQLPSGRIELNKEEEVIKKIPPPAYKGAISK